MSKTINQEKLNASARYLNKLGEANVERLRSTHPEQAQQLEQLSTLFSDQDFCGQFLACPDKQTAVRLFADHGLSLTEEDITGLTIQINALLEKLVANDGELSEDDLEQITGGDWLGGLLGGIGGAILGAGLMALATVIAPGVGNMLVFMACTGGVIGGIGGGTIGAEKLDIL